MATATELDPATPMSNWETERFDAFTSPSHAAGGVAWDILTHHLIMGPDMARTRAFDATDIGTRLPADANSEDWYDFLWTLVWETAGFARQDDGAALRLVDVAKAVAALLHFDVVDDDQPFEVGYMERVTREYEARRIATLQDAAR
jgi:hypothetical protein